MSPIALKRHFFMLAALPGALNAQSPRPRDPVPLRNWPAPLYWQPATTPTERASVTLPASATPLVFVAMTPCRVADTRASQGFSAPFGAPSLAAGVGRTFPLQSSVTCSIPAAAQAYSLNITVVPSSATGFLTAFPTGQSLPLAATLVWAQGSVTSNAAIVPGGTNGSVDFYANTPTDVVIDINGYYAALYGPASNTALGNGVLQSNTGSFNTGTGDTALQDNSTGSYNTATGAAALPVNTTGGFNTALGALALQFNITGSSNTGVGYGALDENTAGLGNTALGFNALALNVTGSNNIAIGNSAGMNAGSGNSGDIYIGSPGASTDSGVIRIGNPGNQNSFFAAGVRGVTTGSNNAVPVMIDSNGQLGTVSSSRRFKEDIHDMGDASRGLMQLRPVVFRYKTPFEDGSQPIQFGLIAEEVAQVYPDLVAHSADGQIETVKYQVLDSMLLNELQRQEREIGSQSAQIAAQKDEISNLLQQMRKQEERLSLLEAALAEKQ
jgi:Chaperone of endosialidase